MKKVRWTEEEKMKIGQLILGSRVKNPEATLISLVNGIVQMLPGERKRKIRTNKEIAWLKPLLHTLWNDMKDESKRIKTIEVKADMSREEMLANLDTKSLLIEAVSRVYDEIQELKKVSPYKEFEVTEIDVDNTRIPKALRTLIVGLEPFQITYLGLNGEYLYHNGKNQKQPLPINVARCILMTRFINHNMQDKCIRIYGREKIEYVNGSISALKEKLK